MIFLDFLDDMKRILTFVFAVAAAAALFVSCNERNVRKTLLPNISGKSGEVIVVIDKGAWEGSVGAAMRDSLAADYPFLPQSEPTFDLANVPHSAFGSMFQVHRNIILMNIKSDVVEPGVVYRKDVWAAPQCVIGINAPDAETAVSLIRENAKDIVLCIEQAERDRMVANARKYEERSIAPKVAEVVGGSPHFPSGYYLKSKNMEFTWVAYTPQSIQQNIMIFKYPVVEDEQMMSQESLVANINALLQRNVPGMFDNTYMTIASAVLPSVKYMKYKGRDFAEVRGLWEVHNDYMGGPFVAHAFYSPDGKDVIVTLASVYAPKYDKRLYLRQVESIIYSFDWVENK